MIITIVDYGMGNIRSIISTLNFLGIEKVILSSDFKDLRNSDKIILPGVGSYSTAIKEIKKKHIDKHLKELTISSSKPILGICLGMQLLGNSSTESGFNEGLGIIDAEVEKINNKKEKIPHVGFNQVKVDNSLKIYNGFEKKSYDFYFTHSYAMKTKGQINQCFCEYEEDFVASYEVGNIAGTQYHPELSQRNGLRVINNFLNNF